MRYHSILIRWIWNFLVFCASRADTDISFSPFLQSVNLKEQSVGLQVNLVKKKWHHLCLTHSIGRAFSGGSLLRCFLDGDLVSSDRCRFCLLQFWCYLLLFCWVGFYFYGDSCERDLFICTSASKCCPP